VFAIPYASREAALQIPGGLVVTNLAIIVHEVFHQFQRGRFATIMSRSEDERPILNEANSAATPEAGRAEQSQTMCPMPRTST
jgi:hypothetical protein